MTQLLNTWASGPGHHGVSAAAVFADGTVWSAAAGRAGLSESLQQSHLIAIGSITKTMTAAIVLQLAAEGRLGLDDPIAKHLPPRLYVSPDITIRQLLNHTSGVANYTGTSGLSQLIAASPGHVFTADELLNVIGPPRFLPGTATEYTNTAFLLACCAEMAEVNAASRSTTPENPRPGTITFRTCSRPTPASCATCMSHRRPRQCS